MADYNSSYTGAEIDEGVGNGLAAPTTYAPIDHAASASTYGAGTGTKYGHLMLSDSTSSTSSTSGGVAATPAAVKAAYDLANGKQAPLTFDNVPTQNSANPVKSGGVYTALGAKADQSALDTFVRPNLLANWYFVGGGSQQGGGQFPINQRGGYVTVPTSENPESLYWTSADNVGVTQGGTINEYSTVVRFGTNASGINYAVYVYNGTEFFTLQSAVVPGYIGVGYGIDRYNIESGGTLTITDKYCSFSGATTQFCEDTTVDLLAGKTVTVSALTYEGILVSATGKVNPKNQDTVISAIINSNNAYIDLHFFANAQSYQMCRIYGGENNSTVNLVAVKLELGDTQTLAHQENGTWVLNEIPNYQQELAKCQRYFVRLNPDHVAYPSVGGATAFNVGGVNPVIVLPVPLRTVPTLSVFGTWSACNGASDNHTINNIVADALYGNQLKLACNTSGGLTVGAYYALQALNDTTADIYISADL